MRAVHCTALCRRGPPRRATSAPHTPWTWHTGRFRAQCARGAPPVRASLIVVIGGGIMGCSVAYHLGQLGQKDVVLLEQGRLTSGTTWHAAGLVGQLRNHESMTRLIRYSTELYARLEAETGLGTGWKQCGSLAVARTADRMIQLKRTAAVAQAYGVACDVLTPQEAGPRYPIMETGDLQ